MSPDETSAWESAYLRFETPAEEVRKFRRRLRAFGATGWPRNLQVLELFCGRGNGLRAWATFGFSDVTGVDVSKRLIDRIGTSFRTVVADARQVPLADASVDVISIHGGLHHLEVIPDDLRAVLIECSRLLRLRGRLVVVEPWMTPFLRFVHFCCRRKVLRRLWPKLDALAAMTELEARTYFAWLDQPEVILRELTAHFPPEQCRRSWGKLAYLGVRPD